MNLTLVDANVLLDVCTGDPDWAGWSGTALEAAADSGIVAIDAVVYAEVSVGFDSVEALESALPARDIERLEFPFDAAFLAGKAFLAYRRRGGERRAPLPDFFIGAHAAVRGCALLTRDASRYRTYFPTVRLIAPD